MRNQRTGNFIPVPTRPAKSVPKSLPKTITPKKSSSSQTERLVLIKEENLSFHPYRPFGQNDGGMRRDYLKAVNYINSCHKFINSIIEKNNPDKTNLFLLPMVTNFIPILPHLIGKKMMNRSREKMKDDENKKPPETKSKSSDATEKSEERKRKSNFGVKKSPTKKVPIDPAPVGDCGSNLLPPQPPPPPSSPPSLIPSEECNKLTTLQLTDIVKEQIQQFWATVHNDLDKTVKKIESPRPQTTNYDMIKQRLQEFANICHIHKEIESCPQIVQFGTVPPPPAKDSEDCSTIMSDTECEEIRKYESLPDTTKMDLCNSNCSLISESSDIRSDSDIEINCT